MKLTDFKLERYFADHEFQIPYLLCCSDCETWTVKEILELAGEESFAAWLKLELGYTEYPGSPELRRRIADQYQGLAMDNVLVTVGAEEAIFIFMNAVLNSGDHLIVQSPCYQSLQEVARSAGCSVSRWEMREEDGWELDVNWLADNIKANTRAIVINSPHNPTGYMIPADKLAAIVDLARAGNILLFSDEVYRHLEYDPAGRGQPACELYENAVSLGVMSKSYGLAGLRIGWVATRNTAVLQKMAAFKDYTSICASAPSEFLATIALQHGDQLVQRNLAIIKANLRLLDEFFATQAGRFGWVRPKAGPIAFPSLKWTDDVDGFCRDLVKSKGVLLLPGSRYDFTGPNFRIGFGRRNLPEALARLAEYLQDNFS